MRTRSRWVALVATAIAVVLIPLAPPAPPAQAQLFGISEQEENRIGRQVEAEVARKPGFVNDPALTQYVAGIGLRLARVSERPNLPWTYHIIRDPSVNAFAAPGGFIFVYQGLLQFRQSEEELAFVLGHETTHVAHRHAVDLAQRDMELQFGAILITQILFGGSLTAYQLSQLARALIDASYSRDKEFEADHYGVIYAQKAGFDPTGSIGFFERLQSQEKAQPGLVRAFEGHPDTPDRIKALRAQLRQMGYQVVGPADAAPPAEEAPPPKPAVRPSPTAPLRPPGDR
ncbi:MAG TPA: M48 family metalloprotease [bacterium]|nr:M48 family metalloprotease [bacterium]